MYINNHCAKEINGDLIVCGSELIKNNLEVVGPTILGDVRSRNSIVENNSYIYKNLEVKKDIKSDNLESNNIKVNQNIEVEGIGLMKNLRIYETAEIKNLNTDTLTNTSDMNVFKDLNIFGLSNTQDISNNKNIYTRYNSFRGSLIDLGLNPLEILDYLNDIFNNNTPIPLLMSTNNQEKKTTSISNPILNLIPDVAKTHPQFEKIVPIFDIKQNNNKSNEPMLMASSTLNNPFDLLNLGIGFNELTFDINNSIYIGIGPAIQILPFITLFPSYFLTDINVNGNTNVDGDIYNYGNTNVSNNIYLGGDIIYTNEENKKLSDKLNSINNKLNYLANKMGLTPEELSEFMNL